MSMRYPKSKRARSVTLRMLRAYRADTERALMCIDAAIEHYSSDDLSDAKYGAFNMDGAAELMGTVVRLWGMKK